MPTWLVWAIRVIATIEVIDSLVFISQDGWFDSSPILLALTAGGFVGLALVWLAGPVLKPGWLPLGIGALLVAAAPAMLYPLSLMLAISGGVAIALGASKAARSRDSATA